MQLLSVANQHCEIRKEILRENGGNYMNTDDEKCNIFFTLLNVPSISIITIIAIVTEVRRGKILHNSLISRCVYGDIRITPQRRMAARSGGRGATSTFPSTHKF